MNVPESPWLRAAVLGFVVVVVFPLAWCSVLWLVARVSGWGRLARSYESNRRFEGPCKRWQSAWFGWVAYNRLLTLTNTPRGLGITIFPLFSAGHPALLVPWKEVHLIEVRTRWGREYATYRLGDRSGVRFTVRAGIVESPLTSTSSNLLESD